jgi:murein DD-endopeptidase MepM/ murein hydrolase activator NlpD
MKRRRHRFLREETVAPWLTVFVILGLWWAGVRLVGRDGVDSDAPGSPQAPARSLAAASEDAAPGVSASVRGDTDRELLRDLAEAAFGREGEPSVRPDSTTLALVPVAGVDAATLTSTFNEARGGGTRRHEAMDIPAPRGTPVLASVDGRIAKLFTSAAGGLTIYQFDEEERYCYYYAHLDAYAANLAEGQTVSRGQVVGYVGTTGNAPPDTPHLHFAIFRLGDDKRWWEGEPLDPITFLR